MKRSDESFSYLAINFPLVGNPRLAVVVVVVVFFFLIQICKLQKNPLLTPARSLSIQPTRSILGEMCFCPNQFGCRESSTLGIVTFSEDPDLRGICPVSCVHSLPILSHRETNSPLILRHPNVYLPTKRNILGSTYHSLF